MKKIWTSINKNRKTLTLLICFFIMGLIIGGYYYLNSKETVMMITDLAINNIYFHLAIISIIIVLSFLVIGGFGLIALFIYEGFSVGYSLMAYSSLYYFKGFIFSLILNLIIKGVYLVLLVILSIKLIKIIKALGKCYFEKGSIDGNILLHKIKNITYTLLIIIFNDVIIYYLGSFVINILKGTLNL